MMNNYSTKIARIFLCAFVSFLVFAQTCLADPFEDTLTLVEREAGIHQRYFQALTQYNYALYRSLPPGNQRKFAAHQIIFAQQSDIFWGSLSDRISTLKTIYREFQDESMVNNMAVQEPLVYLIFQMNIAATNAYADITQELTGALRNELVHLNKSKSDLPILGQRLLKQVCESCDMDQAHEDTVPFAHWQLSNPKFEKDLHDLVDSSYFRYDVEQFYYDHRALVTLTRALSQHLVKQDLRHIEETLKKMEQFTPSWAMAIHEAGQDLNLNARLERFPMVIDSFTISNWQVQTLNREFADHFAIQLKPLELLYTDLLQNKSPRFQSFPYLRKTSEYGNEKQTLSHTALSFLEKLTNKTMVVCEFSEPELQQFILELGGWHTNSDRYNVPDLMAPAGTFYEFQMNPRLFKRSPLIQCSALKIFLRAPLLESGWMSILKPEVPALHVNSLPTVQNYLLSLFDIDSYIPLGDTGAFISPTAVTQLEFYSVLRNNPSAFNSAEFSLEQHSSIQGVSLLRTFPVENVSMKSENTHSSVEEYFAVLNQLMSEAGMEYFFRAPTPAEYCRSAEFTEFEQKHPTLYATSWETSQLDPTDPTQSSVSGKRQPHVVKAKKPNANGFYHSSVLEWTSGEAPLSGGCCVLMGSSHGLIRATCDQPVAFAKDYHSSDTGFRMVLEKRAPKKDIRSSRETPWISGETNK
jgi:hypothetical protein